MAEDILGISGQMDISDIQASFDKLISELDRIGIKTSEVSERMNNALKDISNGALAENGKVQATMQTLRDGIAEINKSLVDTPDRVKALSVELKSAEDSLGTLKSKMSQETVGSQKWTELNTQIGSQSKLVEQLSAEYTNLWSSFSNAQQYIGTLGAAIDTVNATGTIANATNAVSAGIHTTTAVAVGVESVAHAGNAETIGAETQATKENIEAAQQASEARSTAAQNINSEADALERLTERLKQGNASEEEYTRAKESANSRYQQLMAEQAELLEKEREAREASLTFTITDGEMSSDGNDTKAQRADALLERAQSIRNEADAIAEKLRSLDAAYDEVTRHAESGAKKETESASKTRDILQEKEDELKKLNEQLELMEAHQEKGWGGDFFAAMRAGDNPFKVIKDYFSEGDAIEEKKQQIAQVSEELERLRDTSENVKDATTDMFAGMSANDIAETITKDYEQLKILKKEATSYADKNSDAAKQNAQHQKEINDEIIKGRDRLKEMNTSYEDIVKNAKQAKNATKGIGEGSDGTAKKLKGGLTKSLKGVMNGDFSGMLGTVGKIGVYGAAAAAVGKSVQWLSQQAESLREAMMPLKTYLDDNTLENLRKQFVALEYASSHSAEEMAGAGTKWVKYFEGLRGNADAISGVVKTSNDLATVLGTTSDKAAEYQLKIAGAYHQTALEAEQNSTIIINAAKKSTTGYEDIAQALASSANRAQNAGISLKELAAATAYGASTFGSASSAASTYVMMMTRLSAQSKNEYNPSVVGATKALENLAKSNELNSLLTQLLGKRQASLAKVFVQNADAIGQMRDGLNDTASAAKSVAAAESKVENVEKRLENAKKALAHEVNLNLTPAYTKFIEYLSYVIKELGSVTTKIKEAISPAVTVIGNAISWVSQKLKASGLDKYLKLFGYTINPINTAVNSLAGRAYSNMEDDEKRSAHQARLKELYDKALEEKGSPGSAFLAAARQVSSKGGRISKADKRYLQGLMNETRTLQSAKTTGDKFEPGSDNSVKDKESANKARSYREQQAEQAAKIAAEAKELEWKTYVAATEEAIAKEKDVNEKELKQRKLDFEKKRHEIDAEEESLRQKNIQYAKAQYEKDPKNKEREGFYASGMDKNVTLTDDQKKYIKTKRDLLTTEETAEEEKRLKAITDKYKTEAQKRLDIEKKYDRDIAEIQKARTAKEGELPGASTEAERAKIQKQIDALVSAEAEAVKNKGEELVDFDFGLLKKNPEYVQAFEDLNNTSTETLTHLIELFEKYKESAAASMSPEQIREYTSTLQQMYDELLSRENPFKQVAVSQAEYASANEQVKNLEAYIKALDKSGRESEECIRIEKRLGKAYNTREEAEKDLARAKEKRNKAENKYNKALKNLYEKVNALASAITGLGDTIGGTEGKILGLIGQVLQFVTTTADGIKTVAATGANAISAIEKASVILGIISAAIQLLQALSSLYKDSHDQYEEYAEEISKVNGLTNAVNEYRLAVLAANQADKKWFSSSGLMDLADAAEYSQQAWKSYLQVLTQAQAIYENEKGGGWFTNTIKAIGSFGSSIANIIPNLISKGLSAIGLDMDSWLGKVAKYTTEPVSGFGSLMAQAVNSILSGNNYQEGTTAAINNLRIETRKKTHGFLGSGIGAKSQKTQDLRDWARENGYGELFDDDMFINVDAAQSIIDKYGDKLVGETKETLEELIKFKQEYDKFNEQLSEYVSEEFNPLVDNLTDALFDWLDSGKDVMDQFKEYASETFQDIAKDILKTAILNAVFSKYSEAIKSLYEAYSLKKGSDEEMSERQLAESIKGTTATFLGDLKEQIPMLQELLKYMDESWKELGMDISGAQSEQEATTKAINAITEDQASVLTGIGYAMQIALEQGNVVRADIAAKIDTLSAGNETIMLNISEMRDIQYQGLEQLQLVVKNTAPILLIREDIANMYRLMKERY